MPAGYAIFNINVNNSENYKEYIEKVIPIAQKYGAEYIVRGGANQVVEGLWKYPRTVVMKFPTYEKAMEWYNSDEYQPIKKIRLDNAETNGIIIKGV